MKKIIFTLFLSQSLFFTSCENRKQFEGYIPIGENPQFIWVHTVGDSSNWNLDATILVLTDSNDSIRAHFNTYRMWPGKWFVEYRNSYPKVIGKKVFVFFINTGYLTLRI